MYLEKNIVEHLERKNSWEFSKVERNLDNFQMARYFFFRKVNLLRRGTNGVGFQLLEGVIGRN